MNIQIFGTKKCNDTKKAERFFKERGIKYQLHRCRITGDHFGQLLWYFLLDELQQTEERDMRSGGYVIETIEAAVWRL